MSLPAPNTRPTGREALMRDLPASLVVFLVALPLSLGIALASQAPIMAGVIAAVIGGVVAGLVGGAPLQVSGPAAGLTAVVFGLVEQCGYDWYAVTGMVLAAGLLQLAFGVLKVARFALAISPSVVHGMLAGIGILILLGQLQVLLGHAPQSSALKNLGVLPHNLQHLNPWSAALGVGAAAIIFAWPLLGKKLSKVPSALVAVVVMTLASLPLGKQVERISLSPSVAPVSSAAAAPAPAEATPVAAPPVATPPVTPADATPASEGAAAPTTSALLAAIQLPHLPKFTESFGVWDYLVGVIMLALIASVESLLCAVATDKLHAGPRANLDRELIGQGLANSLSGLLGGLSITGVIVRSKANIDAGAASNKSAIFHGLWLLLFVAALGSVVENIPKAVLAGLLVTVGVKLVNVHHIKESMKHGEAIPYFVTVAGIVLSDLLKGVAAGFVVAAVMLLHKLTALTVVVASRKEGAEEGKWTIEVVIAGALTFRSVPYLTSKLAEIPAGTDVRVDLDLRFMDHAGWEALHGWQQGHERTGAKVQLDGLDQAWAKNAPGAAGDAPAKP